MEKTKEKLKKLVSILTSSSILLSSCSSGLRIEEPVDGRLDFKSDNFANDTLDGSGRLSLRSFITADKEKIISGCRKLATDLYDNPSLAHKLKNYPEVVLASYGLSTIDFDVNSVEMQVLLALGDSEIVAALESKDFIKYLKLLRQKEILLDESLKRIDLTVLDNASALLKSTDGSLVDNQSVDAELNSLVFICAVAVLIYVVGATIAAVEVAGYFHFALSAKFASPDKKKENIEKASPSLSLFIDKTPVVMTDDIRIKNELNEFKEYLQNNSELSQAEIEDISNIIANLSFENQDK